MTDGRSSAGSEGTRSPADLLQLWIDARDEPEDEAPGLTGSATSTEPVGTEAGAAPAPHDAGTTEEPEHTEWWPYADPTDPADPTDTGATDSDWLGSSVSAGAPECAAEAPTTREVAEPADTAPAASAGEGDDTASGLPPETDHELEMNSTATWSLEDFERYIRAQQDPSPDPEPEPPAAPVEHALWPAPTATATTTTEPEPDLEDDLEQVWPESLPEAEPAQSQAPAAQPGDVTDPGVPDDAEEDTSAIDLGPASEVAFEPEPAREPEALAEPRAELAPLPQAEPVSEPVPVSEPDPVLEARPEPQDVFQEWFDDEGLRWVSRDGGYVWYSDRGEGWNAELGESTEVPADWQHPPRADGTPVVFPVAPPTPVARAAEPEPEPRTEPEPEPVREPARNESDDEPDESGPGLAPSWLAAGTEEVTVTPVTGRSASPWPDPVVEEPATRGGTSPTDDEADARWPSAGPPTEAMPAQPGRPAESRPLEQPHDQPQDDQPREDQPREDQPGTPRGGGSTYPLYADEPASARFGGERRGASVPALGALDDDVPVDVPSFREYKPRGIYKPLISLVLVLAALAAVAAIFWAVTQRNYVATGVAAGVTFLVALIWWAVLSWNPSVVTVDGAVVEVSRGSDGERFDLRSPQLDIRVDDPSARGWRTTIVRPNGTELVIPASSVDAEEFTGIVKHYRKGLPH